MAKKKLTIEDILVPKDEIPYEVPENWCWVKYDNIMTNLSSSTKKIKQKEYLQEGLYPIIDQGSSLIGGYTNDEELLYDGDLPIIIFGDHTRCVKYVDFKFAQGADGVKVLKPNENIDVKYIYYLMLNLELPNKGYSRHYKFLRKAKFQIPPLAEQERIVKRIESLFDKVDKAAGLVDEARDGFEKRRAAILERAFSGDLTKKWREDNGVSDDLEDFLEMIKEERLSICQSKKEKSDITKMFDEYKSVEGNYPKGWLNLKANMICHNITCGRTPTGNIVEKGEVPYLKVYNIVNNKIDFYYKPQFIDMETLETKLKSSILNPNDVIMNIVGPPLRKIAMIPDDYKYWGMNQAIVRFRTISKVLPKYLYYCLVNEDTLKDIINETRGVVGQVNISVTQSRNLDIPVPPLKEQEEIVRILENMLNKEEQIDKLCDLVDSVDVVKKSILAKAFRGKLGSNNLDEESSILSLKKIL